MPAYARFAALTLLLTSSAHATIDLPTITPVPIPAGTPITDGGGATLDNFVSQDLFANTTADWTTAAIVVELTAGSIYQDALGDATDPPSATVIGFAPSAEFDTYVTSPSLATGIHGAAGDLGNLTPQFDDTTGLSLSWDGGGTDMSNIGSTNLGRFTLSDDAQGTWSLAVTEAFNPVVKFVSNHIINGQMVVNLFYGDLNFDGFVGIEDLNTVLGVWNQDVTPGDHRAGDPSGDGFVGIEDLGFALANFNAGTPLRPTVPVVWPSGLTGDRDGDGFVGITDKVNFNWNQFVTPGSLPEGDTSGDGFVGLDDQNILLSNWNNGTPPSVNTSVPEPMTAVLFLLGGAGLIRRRAQRPPYCFS